MGFHHVAIATRDLDATHRFYTEAMGFELVKIVVGATDAPDGWSKHAFYETGGQGMIAFFELHDPRFDEYDTAISTGLGLPIWVNHLAFHADSVDALEALKQRWLDTGNDVMLMDHEFVVSIYTSDPNGVLVEWCADRRPLTDADKADALRLLADPAPAIEKVPDPKFFTARKPVTAQA